MPRVTGPISTTDPSDVYPTHDALTALGGLREVADHTARNAITTNRRREGMIVYTKNDTSYWHLKASPWAGDDTDWVYLDIGAGPSSDSVVTKTGTYTLTDADDVVEADTTGGTFTLTLHSAVTAKKKTYTIILIGTLPLTIATSQTINGYSSLGLWVKNTSISLVPDGTNWRII